MGRIWIQNTLRSQDVKTSTGEIKSPPGFPGKPTDDCPWSSGWGQSRRAAHAGGLRRGKAPSSAPSPTLSPGTAAACAFPAAAGSPGRRSCPRKSKHRSGSQSHPASRHAPCTVSVHRMSYDDCKACWRPSRRELLKFAESIMAWKIGDKRRILRMESWGKLPLQDPPACSGVKPCPQVSPGLRQQLAVDPFFGSSILREKPSEGTPDATEGNFTLINKK